MYTTKLSYGVGTINSLVLSDRLLCHRPSQKVLCRFRTTCIHHIIRGLYTVIHLSFFSFLNYPSVAFFPTECFPFVPFVSNYSFFFFSFSNFPRDFLPYDEMRVFSFRRLSNLPVSRSFRYGKEKPKYFWTRILTNRISAIPRIAFYNRIHRRTAAITIKRSEK